ncbi:MAG: helix-turn-helix transcriptional regulator [Pseudomonadota bacterium]
MGGENRDLKLLPKVYDSVCDPTAWKSFLNELMDTLNLAATNIFSGDYIETDLTHFYNSSNLDSVMIDYYEHGYSEIEFKLCKAIPEYVREHEHIFENDLLDRMNIDWDVEGQKINKLHAWCKDSFGMHSRAMFSLNTKPNHWDFLTLHFHSNANENIPSAVNTMGFLSPHIAKAININRPFLLLEQRFKAVLDALDRFHIGVVILNKNSFVVVKNVAAEEIIDKGDGVREDVRGKLVFSNAVKTSIDELLENINLQAQGLGSLTVAIERGKDKDGYLMQLSVASSRDLDEQDYYLCLIVDPDNRKIINTAGVEAVYHLTISESHILSHLIRGLTNNEIADVRNVSPETIKTQVKSLFEKLGCSNRIDVVNLVHSVNIPVDPAD